MKDIHKMRVTQCGATKNYNTDSKCTILLHDFKSISFELRKSNVGTAVFYKSMRQIQTDMNKFGSTL